ncbi:MAG: RluA family pseudouridine synthase [Candidatus Izemoplasmatales bacterium]
MELIYKIKKPETILRFLKEQSVPAKIIEMEDQKPKIFVGQVQKLFKDTVKKGDHLHVFIQDEEYDTTIAPENGELNVVFEDDYILVVNKPAEMQIMVTKAHPKGTLANIIQQYYMDNNIKSQIHFVNRLDKESSGLILLAKNRFIKYLLSDRTPGSITREYTALIDGVLDAKKNCINLPIGRVENSFKREVVMNGEECETFYQVIKESNQFSLVRILSETGKTHQIRVHFAHFYTPIVGDEIYNAKKYNVSELMLFSHRIAFTHPITDEELDIRLDLPVVMKEMKIFRK